DSYRQLYGGIDSDTVINRIESPNGLMVAVQNRMASEMACKVLSRDFFKPAAQRLVFPLVEMTTTSEASIRANMSHLFWTFYGEDVSTNSAEATEMYELFNTIRLEGLQSIVMDGSWSNLRLNSPCRLRSNPDTGDALSADNYIELDKEYLLRSWQAVLTVMLADYQFLYE
ncbi:MAG: hypothetical protein JKY01_00150, partial [Pseudomonadales bacterium]|nr:hypothetical protein [Pseudomonadales bacterium]